MSLRATDLRERVSREGYAGPFRAVASEAIGALRAQIERDVLSVAGPDPRSPLQSRHLDSPLVLSLCTAPEIVQRVAAVLGPDLVLWRSNFFLKPPGAPQLSWHRDRTHWGDKIQPPINLTAWIALDNATRENGCVRILPGSGQREFTSDASDYKAVLVDQADEAKAIDMALEPGEFFLFDAHVLHASGANASSVPRFGLAARFTQPHVRVNSDALFSGHRSLALHVPSNV